MADESEAAAVKEKPQLPVIGWRLAPEISRSESSDREIHCQGIPPAEFCSRPVATTRLCVAQVVIGPRTDQSS